MALLGDDGLGYDLARRLEAGGVWRPWLGDACYAHFVHFLASPTTWEAFMRVDDSKSRAQIHLQLRARALLFDKACVSSSPSSSAADLSKLNPTYLQLHGDDVYYMLESSSQEGAQLRDAAAAAGPNTAPSKIQSKAAFSAGSRYGESDFDMISQRFRVDELPESWYTRFIETYRAGRPYKLSLGDRELDRRTPEDMAAYLRHLEKYKRRRVAFKEDQNLGFSNSTLENKSNIHSISILDTTNNSVDDDTPFFPETMYTWNCVPESALPLPPANRAEDSQKMEFYGVLDTLPQVMTRSRSAIMIERLGIRPEYLAMEQRRNLYRGKNESVGNRRHLGEEQASQISKKVISRVLINVGFEGATEVPLDILSQLLSCHICKLGRILKVLSDNYRKKCSAIELLKMFLQTAGYSNLGALAEQIKETSRVATQQAQSQVPEIQSQSQPQHQHQSAALQNQQVPRQMHPQMQPMAHPQNLAYQQQQLERVRRRQASTPRPVMNMEKGRPMVQVKIEASEFPMDGSTFNPMTPRHPQRPMMRQQQIAAMSSFQAQPSNHFRQMSSPQTPQVHTQGMGTARAPPVKVEGFQELMGGDSTPKHDFEENRLTSPSK